MFKNLCAWVYPGGDKLALEEILDIAKRTGYRSIELPVRQVKELIEATSAERVRKQFSSRGLLPGGWQVDDRWRADASGYQQLLKELPASAKMGEVLECRRAFLWMPSYSDERDFDANFAWHVERLRPIARILKAHGGRLGLEWQGPRTLWAGHKYAFVHNLSGTRELIRAIGEDNVGLLLDAWHWFTSQDTPDELRKLRADDVVYVHISDAPRGVHIHRHLDHVREVPGSTGVIDLVGFLECLKEIGYAGPVEPSVVGSKVLEGKTVEEAARINSQALDRLFARAGIKES